MNVGITNNYWRFPGNEDIHLLTTRTKNELRIDLQKFSGEKAYAKYSNFSIGSESEKYKIAIGGYSGNAGEITNYLNDREKKIFQSFRIVWIHFNFIVGDSLSDNNGLKFSTKDQDNDAMVKSCAVVHQGAWWFGACSRSNLNGLYQKSAVKWTWKGIVWYHFDKDGVSMKNARMMIRSKIWCAVQIQCNLNDMSSIFIVVIKNKIRYL